MASCFHNRPQAAPCAALLTCAALLVVVATTWASFAARAASDTRVVQIQTRLGPITVELDAQKAPITVANFLRYVDAGKYDGATFYRAVRLDNQSGSDVPIQVVQGGMFGAALRAATTNPPQTFPPIPHETTQRTGLKHVDGALSMARAAPGSATSEFFICIGDNPALDFGGLRNPDGQGFAAFGRVTAGMDVIRKIHTLASGTLLPAEMRAMHGQVLEEPVAIVSIRRIDPARSGGTLRCEQAARLPTTRLDTRCSSS